MRVGKIDRGQAQLSFSLSGCMGAKILSFGREGSELRTMIFDIIFQDDLNGDVDLL